MSKFYQIIKAFQNSLKRNSLLPSWHQSPRYLFSSHAGGNPGQKKVKYIREVINCVRRTVCYQERKLYGSFLSQIPPTLILKRELSSKYISAEGSYLKTELKKSCDEKKDLVIIPTWMKKPRIRKFQDRLSSNKPKTCNSVQNKAKTVLKVSESKLKLIEFLNRKPTTSLLTELVKQKNLYMVILNKLSLPHLETKNIIGKKNSVYNSSNSHSVLEKSSKLKKITERNESAKRRIETNIFQQRDATSDTNEKFESVNQATSPESADIDNYSDKSKLADSEIKLKKPEDRSHIRRYKQQNGTKEDEQTLKLKAKKFEKIHKPELEFYLKKLAAKYGKIIGEEKVKPKRIYDNNRQRITYDLCKQKEQINHLGNKQLKTEINNQGKCRRVLHESSIMVQKQQYLENKSKRSKILRKEDFAVNLKMQKEIQEGTKKSKATGKMNLNNGLLKDKRMSYEASDKFLLNKKIKTEIISSETAIVRVGNTSEKFSNENKNVKSDRINITNNEIEFSSALTKVNSDRFLNKCKESTSVQNLKIPKEIQQQSTSVTVIENKSLERLKGNVLPISNCLEVNGNNNKCSQNNNKKELQNPVNISQICAIPTENYDNTSAKNEVVSSCNSSSMLMIDKKSIATDSSIKGALILKNEQKKTFSNDAKNDSKTGLSENYGEKSTSETQEKFMEKSENQSKDVSENMISQQLQNANLLQADLKDISNKKMESMHFASRTNGINVSKQRMITHKYKMSTYPPINDMEEKSDVTKNKDGNKNKEVMRKQKTDVYKDKDKKSLVKEKTYLPSKVEFTKPNSIQKLPVPLKMYRFYCHNETLDYRVYKWDYQPRAISKDKINLGETEALKGNDYISKKRFTPLIKFEADEVEKKSSITNLNIVKEAIPHDKKEKRFPPIINSEESNNTLGIANENKVLSPDSNMETIRKTPLHTNKIERFLPIINADRNILKHDKEKIKSSITNLNIVKEAIPHDKKEKRFPPIINSKESNDTLGIANENKVLSPDSNMETIRKTPLHTNKVERFPPIVNSDQKMLKHDKEKIKSPITNLNIVKEAIPHDKKEKRFPPIINSEESNDTLGIANENKVLSPNSNMETIRKTPLPDYKIERFPPIINAEVLQDTSSSPKENERLPPIRNVDSEQESQSVNFKRNEAQIIDIFTMKQQKNISNSKQFSRNNLDNSETQKKKAEMTRRLQPEVNLDVRPILQQVLPLNLYRVFTDSSQPPYSEQVVNENTNKHNHTKQKKIIRLQAVEEKEHIAEEYKTYPSTLNIDNAKRQDNAINNLNSTQSKDYVKENRLVLVINLKQEEMREGNSSNNNGNPSSENTATAEGTLRYKDKSKQVRKMEENPKEIKQQLKSSVESNKKLKKITKNDSVKTLETLKHGLNFESRNRMNNDMNLQKQYFLSSTSETVNNIFIFDNSFKGKKEFLDTQLKNLTRDKQVNENKFNIHRNSPMDTMKMDEYISKFVDIVINKKILGETANTNLFLMHGFNKMSFLKVLFEIQCIAPENSTMSVKKQKKFFPNDDNSKNNSKISLNKIEVLANDLKIMVNKHMEFHKKEMMKKQLERSKQRYKLSVYNLFDTFVLQSFDKVSFNKMPFKQIFLEELNESNIVKESGKIPQQIKINIQHTNDNKNKLVLRDTTGIEAIDRFKKCGRILIKQYRNDFLKVFSFLEVLEYQMPIKNIKNTISDFAPDDVRTQMYSQINSKHMSYYSKYRVNIRNDKEILENKKNIINIKSKNENISTKITEPKLHKCMATYERNYLEDEYKETNLSQPTEKMLTFKEIYEHNCKNNHKNKYSMDTTKQVTVSNGIINSSPTSKIHLEKDKIKEFIVKEKQDIKKKKNYSTISRPEFEHSKGRTSSYSINNKEYQSTGKVEPEVLQYIHKLQNKNMIVTTKKSLTTMSSHFLASDKKSIESILTTEETNINKGYQDNENEVNSNKIIDDKHINMKVGNGKIEKKKIFLKEISYLNDIKTLEKPRINAFDIIKDCKKENFKYLTKVIQNQKNCPKNLTEAENLEASKKFDEHNFLNKQEKEIKTIQKAQFQTPNAELVKNKPKLNELTVASSAIHDLKNDANTTFELHLKAVTSNFKTTNDHINLKDNQLSNIEPNTLTVQKENIINTSIPACMNTNTQVLTVNKEGNISNTEPNKQQTQNDVNSSDKLEKNKKERTDNNFLKAKHQECNTNIVLQSTNDINGKEILDITPGISKQNMKREMTASSLDNGSGCITTKTKQNDKKNEMLLKTKDDQSNVDLTYSTQLINANSKVDKNTASVVKEDIKFCPSVEQRIHIPSKNNIGKNTNKFTSIVKSIVPVNSSTSDLCDEKNINFNIVPTEKNVTLSSSKKLFLSTAKDINKQKEHCNKEETYSKTIKSEPRNNPEPMTENDSNNQNIKKECISDKHKVGNKEVALNVGVARSEVTNFQKYNTGNFQKSINKTNTEIKVEKDRVQKRIEEKKREAIKKNLIKETKLGINKIQDVSKEPIANQNANKDMMDGALQTEHIPSGSRCIKKLHTELIKDKNNLKSQINPVESIPKTNNMNKACLTNEAVKTSTSQTNAKPLTEECPSTLKLNKFLSDRKKQLENITKHKRVNYIKNKLSNNLKQKDENKIIQRPNTLMSLLNIESERKRNEDIKREAKQEIEHGLHGLQKNLVDSVTLKTFPFRKQLPCIKAVLNHQDSANVSNNKSFTDCECIKQNMAFATDPFQGKVAFSEENNQDGNFKQLDEFSDYMLMKTNNTGFNFNEQELIKADNKKGKETSDINSILGTQYLNKNLKTEDKSHKENAVYILKPQPKIEGFISRTLRSSDLRRSTSPMLYSGITKKQWGNYRHSANQSIQSGSKQITPSVLKHKISKHRIFNTDSRINKKAIKKNYSHSNARINRSEFTSPGIIDQNKTYKPLKLCNKELQKRFMSKHNMLETPSRQACRLIQPAQVLKMKPILLKEKIPTKLMACTNSTTAVSTRKQKIEKKDKAGRLAESAFLVDPSQNNNQMKEPQHIQTFQEMCLLSKNKAKQSKLTPVFNIKKSHSNSKVEGTITKKENMESLSNKKEIEENPIQILSYHDALITDKNKTTPEILTTTKSSSNNELKSDTKIESSETDSKLPSLVDTVVNNVKERFQNWPSTVSKIISPSHNPKKAWSDITDIVNYNTLLKGSESIKKLQEKFDNFQNHIRPIGKLNPILNSHRNKKELAKVNQNEIIKNYGNDNDSKPSYKMKIKSRTKRDTFQRRRRISDILKFKPNAIKKTSPQMSYSEVLNKFYACSESQAVK